MADRGESKSQGGLWNSSVGRAWQRGAEVAYDAMGGRQLEKDVGRVTERKKKAKPQGRTSTGRR